MLLRTTLLGLAVATACVTARAAPVPPPKGRVVSLAGDWVFVWSNSPWRVRLAPDGRYSAERPGGPQYEGTWSFKDDTLTVDESVVSPYGLGQPHRYVFVFERGGHASRCGILRINRVGQEG